MRVFVNGETREIPAALKLDQLLEHFSLPKQRIAVEVNREVVRRDDWPDVVVKDEDRIEIIHFVGGG